MKKVLLLLIGIAMSSSAAFAQQAENDTLSIRRDRHGNIAFVTFTPDINQKRNATNEKQIIGKLLNLRSGIDEQRLFSTKTDELGHKHNKYQQYFKGVKVDNAQIVAHSSTSLESVNSSMVAINDMNVTPAITENAALRVALDTLKAKRYIWEDTATLNLAKRSNPSGDFTGKGQIVIASATYNKKDTFLLAWKFNIVATEPFLDQTIYINAQDGSLISNFSNIENTNTPGTASTLYNGSQAITGDSYAGAYRLSELRGGVTIHTYNNNANTSFTGYSEYSDNDNNWTSAEHPNDRDALDAQWGSEAVLDYWSTVHSRNSINGSGSPVTNYTNYGVNYASAGWVPSLQVMIYGKGGLAGGVVPVNSMVSLDVMGHELGHGIAQTEVGFAVSNEAGAINEGISDIWGSCIEYWKTPAKARWSMGEDDGIYFPLRYIDYPGTSPLGAQPTCYGGPNYIAPPATPDASNDYGYIHTNMSVMSHWFYMLLIGGTGTNALGQSYAITPISNTDAQKILYRAEVYYMVSNSTFATVRDNTIQAARDLFGVGSCQEIGVTNAWASVGVGAKYVSTAAFSATVPSICTSGTVPFASLPTAVSSCAWSLSPSGIVTPLSGTGTTISLTRVGSVNSSATLTAILSYSCKSNDTLSKVVPVGLPGSPNLGKRTSPNSSCGWDITGPLPTGAAGVYVSSDGGSTYHTATVQYNASLGYTEYIAELQVDGPASVTYYLKSFNTCGTNTPVIKTLSITARSGCGARMAADSSDTADSSSFIRIRPNFTPSSLFKIYPNPTSGAFTVETLNTKTNDYVARVANNLLPSLEISSIKIFNSEGILLEQHNYTGLGQQKINLDLSSRPVGTYYIGVANGKVKRSFKVIVQH
ncbi:Zn-dependent metalloprotease [Chitinophaga sp. YR573]|uniref:M4 family metallopeptidase n=1 Tax=Chitinophaga sp. YR573 TaxID=1881040 RepID=UPI0008CCE7C7|nr:M4 family metallopeptidase [Chitinophaga sp. YR573]SEW21433.1 Zn-dependent metalloprotease [Chitinophaga sp. YR573]